ncbi:MAG TPA: RNA methyltransferase [Pirellulales bacterium]|nr:RNA methyltransferase [Pirellulales bacterium]
MELITSPQNPRVKLAVKLRDAKGRAQQGRIIIDGCREVNRALVAGVRVVEAFVCQELDNRHALHTLVRLLETQQVPLFGISRAVLERLAFGNRAEGVIAVAEPPERSLADLVLPPVPLVAVLEAVEKPGNVGAVLRSADAAGVSAVIVTDPATDLYNPNCIRASLGTVFSVPVCVATSQQALDWLRLQQLTVYAARLDNATDYRQVRLAPRSAVVLGSEVAGLSQRWRAADVVGLKLPMLGVADSLNISATAAVLFYEALRQRTST